MIRHVGDRKIVGVERVGERDEGDRDEHELPLRGGPRDGDEAGNAALRADERQNALHEREHEREDQCEVTEFRNHGLAPIVLAPGVAAPPISPLAAAALCAFSIACAASGGM